MLTSAGFENPKVSEEFLKLVGKPANQIKIIFIPTASITKEELFYVGKSIEELESVGITKSNIHELQIDQKISYAEVKDFDVMYVCGGNTFHLLQRIRKFGFDNILKKFIDANKVYLGVSAGSIIMGPNIELAKFGDKNVGGLKDFTGLNYIDEAIAPHFTEADRAPLNKFQKTVKYKIKPLTDNQVLLVTDKGQKVIK